MLQSSALMKYAVDLHIHSALSPCSDKDMTPNNIVNMALLKNLDIIALTDHNTASNTAAFCRCAEGRDILAVPGMEIESSEEVHLICLFPDVHTALLLQDKVYGALPQIHNREDIFGAQYIMDEEDNITENLERMLITATNLTMQEIFDLVTGVGGAVIPAHVDRSSYSVISNLGFIPEDLMTGYVEISQECDARELVKNNKQLEKYKLIRSSDAHSLGQILERKSFLELEELSVECLLETLRFMK